MQTIIKPYSYKDIDVLEKHLLDYRDTFNYRHLFASKEWLLSFLELYKPEHNFLIQSGNSRNYFSLSVFDNDLVFTGDPFNDFNGMFMSDDKDRYDFRKIVQYFSELGYKIKWVNLFEPHLPGEISKDAGIQEGVIGLKIIRNAKTQNYDTVVSKRIQQMYERFSENILFYRVFGLEIKNNSTILKDLFFTRQQKLMSKRQKEYNLSFEQKFNEFIAKLISSDSILGNVFIDYCVNRQTGEILASSLNFVKDKSVICYLRAHIQSKNNVSYGLILDYWSNSKNFRDGIEIIDLTRGNESYKYRLGAKEYKLKNFVTILS